MRKIVFILLILSSLFFNTLLGSETKTSNKQEEKLQKINTQIQINQQKINVKKRKEKRELSSLIRLNRKLDQIDYLLKKARKNLSLYENESEKTKHKLTKLEQKYKLKKIAIENRVRQIYKNKSLGILDFVFSQKDLITSLNYAYYFEKIMDADFKLVKEIQKEYKILKTERKKLANQTFKIRNLKTEINSKKTTLAQKKKEKNRYLSLIRREIQKFEKENKELLRTSQEISSLIQRKGQKQKFLGTGSFLRPCRGWISSKFGYRRHPIFKKLKFHTGIDIAAPRGYKISAADSGKVIFAGRWGGYGKATIIDHGNNFTTVYAHQSRILVKKGQQVKKGQLIGYIGSTGYSTGPHLHFEIRKNGRPQNPLSYIK
jgi:murein DD-endopeptidase MepM/ murein hydrolase activator NlpD